MHLLEKSVEVRYSARICRMLDLKIRKTGSKGEKWTDALPIHLRLERGFV